MSLGRLGPGPAAHLGHSARARGVGDYIAARLTREPRQRCYRARQCPSVQTQPPGRWIQCPGTQA